MSEKKKRKRGTRSRKIGFWLVLTAFLVFALAAAVMILTGKTSREQEIGTDDTASTVAEESTKGQPGSEDGQQVPDIFPYMLEDGKLEITSFFQFSGTNPDADDADGENIASIALQNHSEEQLKSAQITAVLTDGREVHFEIKDLPAGKSVMAFSTGNDSYDLTTACESISCAAEFEKEDVRMSDRLSFRAEETAVTVTNNSAEDLENLIVYCHCVLDEEYFGGLTYSYPVERIPAGESVTFDVAECYLGAAEVVRIEQGE